MTVRRRVAQMERWLRENVPTPYKVEVRWVPKIAAGKDEPKRVRELGHFGDCYWQAGHIVIRLSRRRCERSFAQATETLMHEWAHAAVMPNDRLHRLTRHRQEHPDEWALAYGRIYRGWIDDGGCEESRGYDV